MFRRLLFEDGRLAGVQMLGTLQDTDLFFACIKKTAQRNSLAWDLTEPVPEGVSLQEAVCFLRKQRSAAYAE